MGPVEVDETQKDLRNNTESGFEVLPFEPDFQLQNVTISGYRAYQYYMPQLENAQGQVSPIYVELPARVKEFASYDPVNRIINVDKNLLREEHEGTYKIDVEVGYGSANMEQRHRLTMFITLKDLGLGQEDQVLSELPEIVVEEKDEKKDEIKDFIEKKTSIFGEFVPEAQIRRVEEFATKQSLEPAERTGNEPVPTMKDVGRDGVMTIAWSKQMRQPDDLDMLKK